jgi:hypothetical protein
VRKHIPEMHAELGEETIEQARKHMARVRPRFLARDRNGKSRGLRSGWSSLNLDQRAVETGFVESYQLINPLASSFIHETMYGMVRHFNASRDPLASRCRRHWTDRRRTTKVNLRFARHLPQNRLDWWMSNCAGDFDRDEVMSWIEVS